MTGGTAFAQPPGCGGPADVRCGGIVRGTVILCLGCEARAAKEAAERDAGLRSPHHMSPSNEREERRMEDGPEVPPWQQGGDRPAPVREFTRATIEAQRLPEAARAGFIAGWLARSERE